MRARQLAAEKHHQSLFKNTKSYHKNAYALPRSRVKNFKRINQLYLQDHVRLVNVEGAFFWENPKTESGM